MVQQRIQGVQNFQYKPLKCVLRGLAANGNISSFKCRGEIYLAFKFNVYRNSLNDLLMFSSVPLADLQNRIDKIGIFVIAVMVFPIAIGLLNAPTAYAQTTAASTPVISYVASVKPNNSAQPRTLIEYFPGGRLSATAVTVRALLRLAYRIQDYQLVGAPAWFSTNRYDITAKVEDDPPPQLQMLLQTLLADRFKLVTHTETRELPTFALVPR